MLVMSADDSLPDDVETLKRLLRAGEANLARARAEVASAHAQRSDDQALIAHLKRIPPPSTALPDAVWE